MTKHPPHVEGNTRRRQREAVFTRIVRQNLWGNEQSVSGPGSTRERAAAVRDDLVSLLRWWDIRFLLDAPCGDFHWMSALDLPLQRYLGIDIVPELIQTNRRRYRAPGRTFLVRDLIDDPLPATDLILCRDAFIHFPNADVRAGLKNIRRSGSRWLLVTHFGGHRTNDDVELGGFRPLNLQRPPFALPPPVDEINERLPGEWSDKRLALFRISDLPAL